MQSFKEMYFSLNAEQQMAVDSIDGPLLVLAGPGTGKTQLLSARVANILQKTDTLPQSILCLTFTEAAALNMRERLNSMIGDAAYDVVISTYHSFASDIITSYPQFFETIDLETGEDSRMERPIDELRQLEIIKEIIYALPFDDPLRNARYYLRGILGAISDVKQANMSPKHLRKIATNNLSAIETLSPLIQNVLQDMKVMPRKVDQAVSLFADIHLILKDSPSELASIAAHELAATLDAAKETNKTTPITKWKNKWLHKNDTDLWQFGDIGQCQKLISLASIYEKYQAKLQKAGMYDFNDMILRAIEALQEKDELRYNLQEKYQYLLLDEFQDTNAAQFELVRLLADHPVHEGRPNIMAVGDDDQGIFAFQGADIGNMLAFLQTFRDVNVINLVKNYRSHHDILHTAHHIAEQIESRLHHNLQNVTKDIEAASNTLPPKATIARHEFTAQASEFGWIADKIADLIKQGTKPHEISVLAPKHSILESLVAFLNARKIPVNYEKREDIFSTPVVQAILLIAEFVRAGSSQRTAEMNAWLPKVLSLDFWQIAPAEIWKINWAHQADFYSDNNTPWAARALQDEATKEPTEFLLKLASLADVTPLEHMLDYITGAKQLKLDDTRSYTSPLKNYYFSETAQATNPQTFYEAISHLSVIRSHLRDQQSGEAQPLFIHDLLTMYETYQDAEQPLLNTHPIAQAESAVVLQTVYKSKGLEYDYVFLPCMHDDVWGSSVRGNTNKVSFPANLDYIRHDASTEDTRRRLLFVAVTRAKHGLFATSHAQKENGKRTVSTKYLLESEDETGEKRSQVLPLPFQRVKTIERAADTLRHDVDTLWHSRHIQLNASLRSLLKHRLQRYRMSPTHLNNFTNLEYGGPHSFLLNTLLRFPEAPSPDSIYGNALHATLEWFQNQKATPSDKQTVQHYVAQIKRTHLSQDEKEQFTHKGEQALRLFLKAYGKQLREPGVAEVDFRNEGTVLQGAQLTGKIDRLEVDEKNKKLKIIDFKSGSPASKWSTSSKYQNYKQQLYFYMLLLELSNTYCGYTVEQASLMFIEPLNGKAAPPLILKFNQEEYDQFKQLVLAVWQHVQTLDLPDTSTYSSDVKGSRAFINDLISD